MTSGPQGMHVLRQGTGPRIIKPESLEINRQCAVPCQMDKRFTGIYPKKSSASESYARASPSLAVSFRKGPREPRRHPPSIRVPIREWLWGSALWANAATAKQLQNRATGKCSWGAASPPLCHPPLSANHKPTSLQPVPICWVQVPNEL